LSLAKPVADAVGWRYRAASDIGRAVRARRWKKKKEQYRTGQKKVTKGLCFTCLGRERTEAMCIRNCLIGDVINIITCAKVQSEIFMGYCFKGRIFSFPVDY